MLPRPRPAAPAAPRAAIQNRCPVLGARAAAPGTGRAALSMCRRRDPLGPGLPGAWTTAEGLAPPVRAASEARRAWGGCGQHHGQRSLVVDEAQGCPPRDAPRFCNLKVCFVVCFAGIGQILASDLCCGVESQHVGKQQTGERDPKDSSFSLPLALPSFLFLLCLTHTQASAHFTPQPRS